MEIIMKDKIKNIVASYKDIFKDEYASFLTQMEQVKDTQATDFAEVGSGGILERKLLEYPESLHDMIKLGLTDEQFNEFKTKEGSRWFADTFKEFKVPEKL